MNPRLGPGDSIGRSLEALLEAKANGLSDVLDGLSDRGLRAKYEVHKTDTGEPVEACFVLRPDRDSAARVALLAYAMATDNDALRSDLRQWVQAIYDALAGGKDEALRHQVYEHRLAVATAEAEQAKRAAEDANFRLAFTRDAFYRAEGMVSGDA